MTKEKKKTTLPHFSTFPHTFHVLIHIKPVSH